MNFDMSDNLFIFLAAQFIAFLVSLVKIYSDQQAKNREYDLEIRALKMREDEIHKKYEQLSNEILRKFDSFQKDIVEIKLTLKDKVNK